MTAVCILLAICLLSMMVVNFALVRDWMEQANGRRMAEVALATAAEGLVSAQRDMQTAENLHRAERERADFLEEQLHDQDVLLATGVPAGGGSSRQRLQSALSAIKRVSNHAAGSDRARTASGAEPPAVPDPAPARGAGDPPTRPGV